MKQLDAREIQQILFKHGNSLRREEPDEQGRNSKATLLAYLDKAKTTIINLDGSELATLKKVINDLYETALQYRISVGEAQNNLLSTAFAYRFYEQDLLLIREIRQQLTECTEALQTAINYNDLPRFFTYLGSMMGAVISKEEFLNNR